MMNMEKRVRGNVGMNDEILCEDLQHLLRSMKKEIKFYMKFHFEESKNIIDCE